MLNEDVTLNTIPHELLRTSDTPLAAFLISEGYNVYDIEYNGKKAYYLFEKQDSHIDDLIKLFETGRATGNIVLFFNAYQNLLRRIRERY